MSIDLFFKYLSINNFYIASVCVKIVLDITYYYVFRVDRINFN